MARRGWRRDAARGLAGRPPKVRQGTGTGWEMVMKGVDETAKVMRMMRWWWCVVVVVVVECGVR